MRKTLIAAFLLAAAAPALAQPSPEVPATFEQLAPRIDALFQDFAREAHVPGMVWGIVRDGRLVHVGTLGEQDLETHRPVGADTLFRIASMSKAFTALAILKLRDEGPAAARRARRNLCAGDAALALSDQRQPAHPSPRPALPCRRLRHRRSLGRPPAGAFRRRFHRECCAPACPSPARRRASSNIRTSAMPCSAGSSPTSRAGPIRIISRPRSCARSAWRRPATTSRPRRRRAARSAIASRTRLMRASRTCAHGAFGAMGGVQTSANDYARWVAFLLSAWPPRDGAERGPVRRASVRELSQGLNFPAVARRPGGAPEDCPQAAAYGMGMRVAVGLRPRPHPGAWRRLSGLRLLPAAPARAGRRHLRLRQPHLCRPVAAGLAGGARAPPRRPAPRPRRAGQRRAGRQLRRRRGDVVRRAASRPGAAGWR